MKDPYNVEQAQKTKESSSLQDEVDEEIKKEAQRTEAQNYKKAKDARMKLEKSAQTQKETTDEMRRQGETIHKAKGAAINVHDNAGKAEELADSIEKESHMFNFGIPFKAQIKKWWNKNRREASDVENIKKREQEAAPTEGEAAEEVASNIEEEDGEEYVPGQKKTDSELHKILHSVKSIKKEATVQKNEASKQKVDLQDINKLNEYSKKKVDKTDEQLRKGL